MTIRFSDLELAERTVAETQARMLRQRALIRRKAKAGHDVAAAFELLRAMQSSLRSMEQRRDSLRRAHKPAFRTRRFAAGSRQAH